MARTWAILRARHRELLLGALVVFVPLGLFEALAGELIYAGIVAGAVAAEREGARRPLAEILRRLPIMRRVIVDLLLALGSRGRRRGDRARRVGGVSAFGETLAGHWLAARLVNMVAAPPFALAVVVLFYELRGSRPGPSAA